MVSKEEVGKSAAQLARKIILGLAVIGIILSACIIVKYEVIDRYKNRLENTDTSITNEDNTETTIDESEAIQAKYSALLKMNPDFVGKLYIDAIDEMGYNVVQCDNNEKYLTTGFKGETTRYGTLFVDYRNDVSGFSTNTIIYGHNMRDGSQLGSLYLYNDIDNYKSYPTVRFNTIYKNTTWKIFAAFLINADKKDDNGYAFPYLTVDFPTEEKFNQFISEVKQRSYFINENVDVNPDDKILTLSTCDTAFNNARFVVMARLVRDGESEEVDVSTARVNENQRFPQAWYDKKGKTNPFKNAENFSIN